VAILHIPLFTISIYGLALEKIKTKAHSINWEQIKWVSLLKISLILSFSAG
jgi:hypothetical protein